MPGRESPALLVRLKEYPSPAAFSQENICSIARKHLFDSKQKNIDFGVVSNKLIVHQSAPE